jgi:hypothetical protein
LQNRKLDQSNKKRLTEIVARIINKKDIFTFTGETENN